MVYSLFQSTILTQRSKYTEAMNHSWKNNTCVNCGLYRMTRQYKKIVRTYSKLINGVWEDVPVYQYGVAWYYGWPHEEHINTVKAVGFVRPDCVPKEVNV